MFFAIASTVLPHAIPMTSFSLSSSTSVNAAAFPIWSMSCFFGLLGTIITELILYFFASSLDVDIFVAILGLILTLAIPVFFASSSSLMTVALETPIILATSFCVILSMKYSHAAHVVTSGNSVGIFLLFFCFFISLFIFGLRLRSMIYSQYFFCCCQDGFVLLIF